VCRGPEHLVDGQIAAASHLGADQRDLVRKFTISGHRTQCAIGRAGSGKTTALAVAAKAWQAAGYRVVRAAVKGEAAAPVSRAMGANLPRAAGKRLGVPARWHDLRHHHASVLLSEGVNPSKVADRLSHDLRPSSRPTHMCTRRTRTGCVRSLIPRSANLLRTG